MAEYQAIIMNRPETAIETNPGDPSEQTQHIQQDRLGKLYRIATVEHEFGIGGLTLASLKGKRQPGKSTNGSVNTDRVIQADAFRAAFSQARKGTPVTVQSVSGEIYEIPHETAAEMHADL